MANAREIFAINTYSYTFDMSAEACLAHLADRGYRAFEIMLYPGHLWPSELDAAARKSIRTLVESRDLRIITLNMPNVDLNIAGATQEMRDYSIGVLSRGAELAGDIGAENMIMGPGKPNPLFPAPKERLSGYFFSALDTILPIAEKAGVSILGENMTVAYAPDADSLMEELARYGNDDIGVCYDIANGHFIGENPVDGLRRVKDRLKLVHISDTNQKVYKHDPVGYGDVPFAEIPPVLKEIGYQEMPMLEVIFAADDPDPVDSAQKLIDMGWTYPAA